MNDESDNGEHRCLRCSDEYPADREKNICETCEKEIQRSKIIDGVRCEHCDGHGWVYSSWGDIQRAMNGRDKRCPECHGSGRVAWDPDPENVHPDLRAEVPTRV
jgi:DNA-directed RNA polymerase subunit RPC12/RpoP